MKTSESIINIAAALSAAQAEMPAVAFDSVNPFLKNKFASLGAVILTSQPVLAKHGLSVVQFPISGEGGSVGITTRIMHSSGEWLEESVCLPLSEEKGKSAAQVAGSIVTYLRRYSLQSVLRMYGDEDTDGHATGDAKQVAVSVKVTRDNAPEAATASAKAASREGGIADPQQGWKDYFLKEIKKRGWQKLAWDYAVTHGWIKGNQRLIDIPKAIVPNTRATAEALMGEFKTVCEAGSITQELDEAYTTAHLEEAVDVPAINAAAPPAWKELVFPFGKSQGTKLGDMTKETLWYWTTHYEPKPYKGKISEKDLALKKALDEAKLYYGFKDKADPVSIHEAQVSAKPADSDVPF